jgi:8-oxo-dGTP pyrophosphatase MutT (NUDIX family)
MRELEPALPHPASTVVLVRPILTGGFEVFMNRRPEMMDTYAGAYVFPGGRVEKSDWSSEMLGLIRGLTPLKARDLLAASELQPELCLGHWVAAVRELFEEAGIHLFMPQSGLISDSVLKELSERLAKRRSALQRGVVDLPGLLTSEALLCDLGSLTYFFHRVTPEHYPVRFDTRFYLAPLPPHQRPLQVSEEVSESLWISPQGALDRCQSGDFPMMPPTVAVLRMLASQQSWQTLSKSFGLREARNNS